MSLFDLVAAMHDLGCEDAHVHIKIDGRSQLPVARISFAHDNITYGLEMLYKENHHMAVAEIARNIKHQINKD